MSSLALLGLEWSRPFGLAALALPPIVWWLARRARGAPLEATGTLEVWREVAREHPPVAAGRRTSLALWLALAALACGALALAGPRDAHAREPIAWRVVVDRSPSMYLPHDGANGPSRLEVALARARVILGAVREVGDTLEWRASDGASERGDAPPAEWSSAPYPPLPELAWSTLDARGTLVVTDRAPAVTPAESGFVACGGAACPGPIAQTRSSMLVWDGSETRSADHDVLEDRIVAAALPTEVGPLKRAFDAWASARGVLVQTARSGGTALELAFAADGAELEVRAGRDGWSARGTARALSVASAAPSEAWLSAQVAGRDAPIDLVRWRLGRIEIGWRAMEEPDGDPAAFAVSWARLFDAALPPPRGVVALEERQAAGDAGERRPERPASSSESESGIAAVLAALAAALALVALALRR